MFGKLLQNWLNFKGWNQTELSKKMGIKNSNYISQLINEKRKNPWLTTKEKFAKAFDVSVEEFMGGPPNMKETLNSGRILNINKLIEFDPTDTIPILTTIKCAEDIDLEKFHPIGEEYKLISRYGVKGKNIFAVQVEGDSMEPDIKDGDILILNPDKAFNDVKGGIGVILRGESYLIRKVFLRGDNYILEPSNKAYDADIVPYTGTTIFKIVKMVRDWK